MIQGERAERDTGEPESECASHPDKVYISQDTRQGHSLVTRRVTPGEKDKLASSFQLSYLSIIS